MKLLYSKLVCILLIASTSITYSFASNSFLEKKENHIVLRLNQTTSKTCSTSHLFSQKSNSALMDDRVLEQKECDTIILNDGKLIRVNIKSTSESDVHYTNCENDDTLEFIISKNNIKAIQYANGIFEFVKHKSAEDIFKEEQRALQNEKATRLEAKVARLERGGTFYKNSIYGSFAFGLAIGSGTIFYERIFGQKSSEDKLMFCAKIGMGMMATWDSDGNYVLGQIGMLKGNKSHHFESSIGMLHFYKGFLVDDFKESPIGKISASIGYRYQRPQDHFIF